MKFDKVMEILYKGFCIFVSCVVLVGSVVSCFANPVSARAFDPTDVVEDFWNVYWQNLEAITKGITHDIQNGNLDATSDLAKQRLKQIGIQMMFRSYDPSLWELSTDWDDTTVISAVGGATGFYVSANDGLYHCVNVSGIAPFEPEFRNSSSLSWTLCSSDEFSVTADLNAGSSDPFRYQTSTSSSSYYSGIRYYPIGNSSEFSANLYSSGYFNFTSASKSGNVSSLWHSMQCTVYSGNPPALSKSAFNNFVNASYLDSAGFSVIVGGYGQQTSLPDGEINNNAPWVYYNDTLIPYIKQIVPEYDIDYFVFPDGYTPPLTPDPTEPGSFPNGGINIGSNNNINIDIDINYPTYPNGEPVTDESGETVTETYYVTDTTPTDVVYKFTIPTLPNLDRYSDTLPLMNLAQFESGINFIFSAADGIFTDTGFLPVIIVTLSLCALCYVIWKIGG